MDPITKAGWPARTYIQQLCADTGCSLEDLLGTMGDRDWWQESVREIWAGSAIWWWWWYQLFLSNCNINVLGVNISIRFSHIKLFIHSYRHEAIWWWGSIPRDLGMLGTPSLPLLLGQLWPGVVVAFRVSSMGQTEIFNHLLYLKPFNYVQTNDC